jgi:hypothetical protein
MAGVFSSDQCLRAREHARCAADHAGVVLLFESCAQVRELIVDGFELLGNVALRVGAGGGHRHFDFGNRFLCGLHLVGAARQCDAERHQ